MLLLSSLSSKSGVCCRHRACYLRKVAVLLRASYSHRCSNDSTTAAVNHLTGTAKVAKRGKKFAKYVELIQVETQNGSKATKRFAKIKRFSATKVLRKLGVDVDKNSEAAVAGVKTTSDSVASNIVVAENISRNSSTLASEKPVSMLEQVGAEYEIQRKDTLSKPKSVKKVAKRCKNETKENDKFKLKGEISIKQARRSPWPPNLCSYVDVCIQNKLTWLAQKTLMYYHKSTDLAKNPQAVNVYNLVLHGWAREMNYNKLKQLLSLMEKDGAVLMSLQSYSAAIECAVRTGQNKEEIQSILQRLKQRDLDIGNIFTECKFVKDQREKVIQGIRMVLPEFNPKPVTLDSDYDCTLVDKLNGCMPKSRYYTPMGEDARVHWLQDLAKLQMKMECTGHIKVKSIVKPTGTLSSNQHWSKVLNDYESNWKKNLKASFETNLNKLKKESLSGKIRRMNIYPYLTVMPVDTYIDYMMQEIETLARFSETFSPALSVLQSALGAVIMERYFLETKKSNGILAKVKKLYNEYCMYYCTPELTSKYTPRQYWEFLLKVYCNGADIDYPNVFWPQHILMNVGRFLYNILQSSVQIENNLFKSKVKNMQHVPAFYTVYRKHNVIKLIEEIKPNPILVKLYYLANRDDLTFNVNVLPMMSPPRPWNSIHGGGFLIAPTPFVRLPGTFTNAQDLVEKAERKTLFPVFDSLNQLGECPWKINERILDVVIKIFNEKGSSELDIPQPPSECPLPEYINDVDKRASINMKKKSEYNQKKAEMYSLWCDMLYKLSIANQVRKNIIWFPQNLDFRGRTYPCPPHFNHLGSDVCRALLLFAKGEKLGPEGLRWLKIHLINLTGSKKRSSLDDRLKYCDEIMELIIDAADNPLGGHKWWIKSDEPWQTLACCMELTSALRFHPPYDYVSHFPVHQDGSCNGLQHYAALGRDVEGAEQVNLLPRATPQDVYSKVAELVELERAKDAANGCDVAKALEGFVSRKVVKQPVMTTVYGVTRYGARHQILKRLKEIPDFPRNMQWKASSYLVTKTFNALQQMFCATKRIQNWLTQCAGLLASVCCQPVKWITPLGLPVCQPYFKTKKIEIQKQKKAEMDIKEITNQEMPNAQKQKNGFPPNYIHSLDSSHMMLTSLFCQRAGITFVSVHDCYWTHPSSVDAMNVICREQFVALHSQPLLPTLSDYMLKAQKEGETNSQHDVDIQKILSDIPRKGSFNLHQVLKSTYFFS